MLTEQQRLELRRALGHAVLELQDDNLHYGAETLMPELVAALVSLAAYFARNGAAFARGDFEALAYEMARHEWEDPDASTPLQ